MAEPTLASNDLVSSDVLLNDPDHETDPALTPSDLVSAKQTPSAPVSAADKTQLQAGGLGPWAGVYGPKHDSIHQYDTLKPQKRTYLQGL
jgi:hypothetical protein